MLSPHNILSNIIDFSEQVKWNYWDIKLNLGKLIKIKYNKRKE